MTYDDWKTTDRNDGYYLDEEYEEEPCEDGEAKVAQAEAAELAAEIDAALDDIEF